MNFGRSVVNPFRLSLALVSLVVVLLALVGCGTPSRHEATPALATVRAQLGLADRSDQAERLELSGTVEAERVSAVSSRVMAPVLAVHVQLGDFVRKGQVLVSIDATSAQGQVAQASGSEAQAQAALAMAERNLQRFEALAAKNAASGVELDQARMLYEQAKGAVAMAQGAVAAASSVSRESKVVAPFAGRVAQRLVEVGDLATPGRPLLMIESQAGRRVSLAVPESLAVGLVPGAALPIRLDARPELGELPGTILEVSAGPDPRTHAFTVKVGLEGVEAAAGAAARGVLAAKQRSRVLVPAAALIEQGSLTLVVARDEAGLARSRVVRLGGREADGRVEVLAGLAGGETLLLGLAVAPADGAPVEEIPGGESR